METTPTRETHEHCERCGELIKCEEIVNSIYGAHCQSCFDDIEGEDYQQTVDDDWDREQAMQLGMGFGINAYNDAKGNW